MALNALQEQRMKAIKLDAFLKKNGAAYKAMATEAYAYTAKTLAPTKQTVRQDDVSGHLEAQIELDQGLKDFLARAHKSQQYWTRYFTFLILDVYWEELVDEYEPE